MTDGNFDDAVQKLKLPRLVCPHCGEKRLDKMLPKGDGQVYCTTCAEYFEVKP